MNELDYEIGLKEELEILGELRKLLKDDDIIHIDYKFSTFDFKSPDKFIELKRRYCYVNKYPDTMIPVNKIDVASLHYKTKDFYFVFKFDDGIFSWKFDPKVCLEKRMGGRCDRGKNEKKPYYFIPNSLLKPLGKN